MSFLLFLSDAMVPLMIFYIVGFGILSGRPVLDDFIRGVKDGVKTVGGFPYTDRPDGISRYIAFLRPFGCVWRTVKGAGFLSGTASCRYPHSAGTSGVKFCGNRPGFGSF